MRSEGRVPYGPMWLIVRLWAMPSAWRCAATASCVCKCSGGRPFCARMLFTASASRATSAAALALRLGLAPDATLALSAGLTPGAALALDAILAPGAAGPLAPGIVATPGIVAA